MDDGFYYPVVNEENCIHCDQCENVCPFYNSKRKLQDCQTYHCYYGWHKNEDTRKKSTSGGAFSAIAECVIENDHDAVVYGAVYDDKWRVCHRGIDTRIGLDELRQSKYVQSDMGNCYSEIRKRLNQNEQVLFCGTPCQVDGLRLFLGKDYEKLFLVDFVCHGVTSPLIFKSYILYLENKHGSRVRMFRFRDKVTRGNVSSLGHTTIVFDNGIKKSSEFNLYLGAYINGLMQRMSCETCHYASHHRRSDITLGDFWGIEEIIPKLRKQFNKGISLILSNSDKGQAICRKLSKRMYLVETELSYAFNGRNAQLEKPVQVNNKNRRLYANVQKIGVIFALAKALGSRKLLSMHYGWIKNSVKAHLPKEVYRWMVFIKRSLYQL